MSGRFHLFFQLLPYYIYKALLNYPVLGTEMSVGEMTDGIKMLFAYSD